MKSGRGAVETFHVHIEDFNALLALNLVWLD